MTDSEIWWERTPGSARFLETVSEALMGKGTIWISELLAWAKDFREVVKGHVEESDSGKYVEFIDASKLEDTVSAPDLVFSFDSSLKGSYLPAMSLAKFVCENSILSNTVIWIYGLDSDNGNRWLEISKELAATKSGLKVVCEGSLCDGINRGVRVIIPSDYISEFDSLHFVMSRVTSDIGSPDFRIYISRIANEIVGCDVESSVKLLENVCELTASPVEYCLRVLPTHDEQSIKTAIWNAQIKSLFPIIEQRRRQLISQLETRLSSLLPFFDEWRTEFFLIEDVELRHLIYFEAEGKLQLSYEENKLLRQIYNMRNDLSHLRIVNGNTVLDFLR